MFRRPRVRSQPTFRVLAICLAAAGLGGCGGDPLDYETAMNLVRDRKDSVRTTFSATIPLQSTDPQLIWAYQKLVYGHIIECKTTTPVGTLCEPGPAGDALSQNGLTELSLVAGRWVPSAVLSIQRTGRNSAIGDVRMSFEASPLFREYQDSFDKISAPGFALTLSSRQQGKVVHVTFQRYEDGWHVENVE
jgi:hypothetical protein